MKFEWCLASFGLGICTYFAWPHEPVLWFVVVFMACLLLAFIMSGTRHRISDYILLLIFLGGGFGRSILHTRFAATPILPVYEKTYEVSGWIENINKSGALQHFYIRVQSIKNMPVNNTPYRVRIRLKPNGFAPGDAIRIRAVLSAPKIPVLAGGYDPARAAYFQKIGGYGFAISKPEPVVLPPLSKLSQVKRALVKYRFGLSRKIQMRAPPETAGLQAALLTGDRSAIPEHQKHSLRRAGLAHLLAISGLHMGLLAGGAYGMASLLFSMIGPLSRRYDMRKYAAVLGTVTACIYLLLSGASVSTQRAFIMAVIVFMAIILNRRAVSLRSVALAAGLTLMLHPESLVSAGFQMSFAATTALVVVYRKWSNQRDYSSDGTIVSKFRRGFVGIFITSLVAGFATGGFAALHFHRFARLGLIANIVAMPIFTFIVMPAGFLSIVMMPFGLDRIALNVMGWGLYYVLYVAEQVANLKQAVLYIKGANGVVAAVYGFGFLGVCFGAYAKTRHIVIISGLGLLFSFVLWWQIDRADMRISDKARIAFWDRATVNILHVDRKRGDKFGRSRFIEAAGVNQAEYRGYFDTRALCDQLACRIALKNNVISIVAEPEGVLEACDDSDLVVLTNRKVGVRARHTCKAILIDAEDLATNGAHDIYFTNQGIKIKSANPERRKKRPWGR